MAFAQENSSLRVRITAVGIALLLHGFTLVALSIFEPLSPDPVLARNPEPIDVVFLEPKPTVPPSPTGPTDYTQLPPDRAGEKPEHAEFLSNVDSRAQDQVPGGDDALPRLEGDSDAPMVALEPDGGARAELAPQDPSPPPSASGSEVKPLPEGPGTKRAREEPNDLASLTPDAESLRQAQAQRALLLKSPGSGAEFYQPEMSNPEGNAALFGDVTLNTMAWEYAPWLERFHRELMRSWFAPTAYYMGMLKEGGWALFEIEVAPTGEVLRLVLLEEEGHSSLTQASHGALEACAPLEALPSDFPEKTLIMRLRMVYPKARSR